MLDLNSQIAVLETQMKQVLKQVDEGFSQNSKEHQELLTLFEKALEKKADKEVVDELKSNQNKVIWLILSTVIIAVIGLVITKY